MFENIEKAYKYLFSKKGSAPIDNLVMLFEKHGNFHLKIKTIHITGTNGKGSTTNYVASVLKCANYKTATFTSPHLLVHNDRIKINGINISDEKLLEYLNEYYDEFEELNLGMFQIDTFIAFKYFYDEKVDFAVIEVGIGGLSDCTNLILPIVSVITSIGYDHMEILGKSIEDIAYQKAGIIKPLVPVIVNVKDNKAFNVISKIKNDKQAPLYKIKKVSKFSFSLQELIFDYDDIKNIKLINAAMYQLENASLAIETIKILNNLNYCKISTPTIKEGLLTSCFPGRFETISTNPYIIVDGAHNIHGIKALLKTIKQITNKNIKLLYSALLDKNPNNVINELLENINDITICEFPYYRAYKIEDLDAQILSKVKVIKDYQEALKTIIKDMKDDDLLIITGSLYFISDARKYLLSKNK